MSHNLAPDPAASTSTPSGFILDLWQDLRFAIRMLTKNLRFSAFAVFALTVGIGANTAVFSLIKAVLLQGLPYREPDRLVILLDELAQTGLSHLTVSAPEFKDYRDRATFCESIAAFKEQAFSLTGRSEAERIGGALVSSDFFHLLGVTPAQGRSFSQEEEQTGKHRVVVLSEALWQRRFGSDQKLIGTDLTLDGNSYTVIGVTPKGFEYPREAELWMPLAIDDEALNDRDSRFLSVIARLKPRVTLVQAQSEMNVIAAQLQLEYPSYYPADSGWGISVFSLHAWQVRDVRTALLSLFGAVGFVLLIACGNVISLLLARATARRKEIAVRIALGATRGRVARQLLTESMVLSIVGGASGLSLAKLALGFLIATSPPGLLGSSVVALDETVLAFTAAVSLAAGIVFGLLPALKASKVDIGEAVKESGRGASPGAGHHRILNFLVIAEIAVSFLLLIGAGLMVKSFMRLQSVEPGFDPRNVNTLALSLPRSRYLRPGQVATYYNQVLARVGALPGVRSAGAIDRLPLAQTFVRWGVTTQARPAPPPLDVPETTFHVVSPGYFETLGVPLIQGRSFRETDNEGAPLAVVVNRALAREFGLGEDVIGKRLKIAVPDAEHVWDAPWLSIVGVVGNMRAQGLNIDAVPEMYVCYLQNPWRGQPEAQYTTMLSRSMSLAVKSDMDPAALIAALRNEIAGVDPDIPITNVTNMSHYVTASVAAPRFSMTLLVVFGSIALVLALLGIYGIIAYTVAERTHEIGIRTALGATPGNILRLVLGQAVRLAVLGIAVGIVLALSLTRVLSSILYGVSATDLLTFSVVALLMGLMAAVASYFPARKAAQLDPVSALSEST